MGEPGGGHTPPPRAEHIGAPEATRGTETSKYPEEEKSNEIALVAASERAPAQTRAGGKPRGDAARGVVGPRVRGALAPRRSCKAGRERNGMGRPAEGGESPVREPETACERGTRVGPDT